MHPKRQEQLPELVPVCCANALRASLAKGGARLHPKRQEQLPELVPVCCANALRASLAKGGARLRPKRQEQLPKLVPVCCANAVRACLAKVALGCALSAKSSSPSSSLFAAQMRYALVSLEEVYGAAHAPRS
ncbi:hypothetical protein [Paenibacillus etheri]|uniref:Uncharacterized protein n=1 Tax=Paenibacillus etheri TaxID=1306852 RepID=A0A0W1APT3_9BACL|nr:hypothetical protein [Paenibacillus etheri]KTD83264.1 hypothetical protein UQ64_03065 [Paenibacillus etheri]